MVNGTSALLVSWVLFKRGSVVKGSRSNTHLKRNTKVWGTWAGRPAGRGVREVCPRCPWGRQWPGRVQTRRLPRAGHASFSSLLGLVRSPGCLKVGVNSILMRSRSRGHVALGNPRGKFTGRGYGGRGTSSPLCRHWAQGGFRQLLVQLPPQAGADGGSGGGQPFAPLDCHRPPSLPRCAGACPAARGVCDLPGHSRGSSGLCFT